ncbi:MAG: hypothetical protein ACOZQL_28345 [Myxococcota bacterium]
MHVAPLSETHLAQIQLATERALQQWAKDVIVPTKILAAMDRVMFFLKQNGGAAQQARQVASLAFIVGEQLVHLGGWRWMSVSDDGSLNPAIVSPDGARACLLVDAVTLMVSGEAKGSISALAKACLEGTEHPMVTRL